MYMPHCQTFIHICLTINGFYSIYELVFKHESSFWFLFHQNMLSFLYRLVHSFFREYGWKSYWMSKERTSLKQVVVIPVHQQRLHMKTGQQFNFFWRRYKKIHKKRNNVWVQRYETHINTSAVDLLFQHKRKRCHM